MADSPAFELVCERFEAEQRVGLTRLQCDAIVRNALRDAGLVPSTVSHQQLEVVISKSLPDALEENGFSRDEAVRLCSAFSTGLLSDQLSGSIRRKVTEAPESLFERLDALRSDGWTKR